MTDLRAVAGAMMRALVEGSFGCIEATAAAIDARWGRGGAASTISRKLAGHLDWTIADVVALEDAAGRFPVTQLLARRLEAATSDQRTSIEQAGRIALEAGEAVAMLLTAVERGGDDGARTCAVKELLDVEEAARAARARLQGH